MDLTIIVESESVDEKYKWEACLSSAYTCAELAKLWATKHGVPAEVVGFETQTGKELDLKRTLGEELLEEDSQILLTAFPVEPTFMEDDDDDDAKAVAAAPQAWAAAHLVSTEDAEPRRKKQKTSSRGEV